MNEKRIKLDYQYSKFWLILWAIFFFPVALVLLFTGSRFSTENKTYSIRYEKSRFWLCFWTLCFFPVALLLIFLNGWSITIAES